MLTQMNLTNFKSWKQTGDIRLAPLTGFFGANSSGKSSLLQLLLMLKATTESSDRNVLLETSIKDYVELGTLLDLIRHEAMDMTFSITWDLIQPIQGVTTINFLTTFAKGYSHRPKSVYVKQFTYTLSDLRAEVKTGNEGQSYHLHSRPDDKSNMSIPFHEIIKCYGFSRELLIYYQNTPYLNDLVSALEQQFARVYHLGPVREYTHRNYGWGGDKPSDVGRMGERSIFALLAGGDAMINKIAHWLKEMGLSDSFAIKKVIGTTYQVELTHIGSDRPVLLPDMGFGVSQVLPVLVACYAVPEGSTLLIEQPEMHLHPRAQSVLADMFIEVMKERKVQLIIESHSEHLLARLQRRMAEDKLDVDQTAFYFCELRDGESHITALEMDEYGEIKNYPDDFFGDLTGDVFERARMSIERRMQQVAE